MVIKQVISKEELLIREANKILVGINSYLNSEEMDLNNYGRTTIKIASEGKQLNDSIERIVEKALESRGYKDVDIYKFGTDDFIKVNLNI